MERASRHRALLIIMPLAIAIILRLYPYFLSGIPYGSDTWVQLRNANELLANSPTKLGGNPIFDNYNIYWPGVTLFGAISSLVLGNTPTGVMPILVPLVGSLTTLFFFVIVERLTKSPLVASIASLLFATAGFDSIFMAMVTKETYAYPLFMCGILLLTFRTEFRTLAIFTLISIAMALAHHVTVFIFLTIVSPIVITKAILSLGGYEKMPLKFFIFPGISGIIVLLYFEVYALPGWSQAGSGVALAFQNAVPLIALFIVSLAGATYIILSKQLRSMLAVGGVLIGISAALIFLGTKTSVLPFAPVLPEGFALLSIPFFIAAFFGIRGYKILHDGESKSSFAFIASWLAATIALVGYAIIGTSNGLFLIHRLFTFLYAPAAILAAVGLARNLSFPRIPALRRGLVVAIVLSIAILSAYASYASVIQKQPLLGANFNYSASDVSSARWVATNAQTNVSISGDAKFASILGGSYALSVGVNQGYADLLNSNASFSGILITYARMSSQGYGLTIYTVPLPNNWQAGLSSSHSLVYDNGNEMIWSG